MALCNARTKGCARYGQPPGRCRAPAMANGRCRFHGGRLKGPVTAEGKARTEAARLVGHKRYIERMKIAKALGIIEKIPGGHSGGQPTKVRFRLMEIAREIALATIQQLPAPVEKAFEEQTMGEQLATVTRMSLKEAHRILCMPDVEDNQTQNLKLLSIKKDTALSLIATQVRVDESVMRRASADRLPAMLERLRELGRMVPGEPKIIDIESAEAEPIHEAVEATGLEDYEGS